MNGQKKNKYILQIPKQRCSGKEKDDKGGRKKVGNTVRDKSEWKKQRDNVDREEYKTELVLNANFRNVLLP